MGLKLPNSLMVVSLDAIDAFTLKPFLSLLDCTEQVLNYFMRVSVKH